MLGTSSGRGVSLVDRSEIAAAAATLGRARDSDEETIFTGLGDHVSRFIEIANKPQVTRREARNALSVLAPLLTAAGDDAVVLGDLMAARQALQSLIDNTTPSVTRAAAARLQTPWPPVSITISSDALSTAATVIAREAEYPSGLFGGEVFQKDVQVWKRLPKEMKQLTVTRAILARGALGRLIAQAGENGVVMEGLLPAQRALNAFIAKQLLLGASSLSDQRRGTAIAFGAFELATMTLSTLCVTWGEVRVVVIGEGQMLQALERLIKAVPRVAEAREERLLTLEELGEAAEGPLSEPQFGPRAFFGHGTRLPLSQESRGRFWNIPDVYVLASPRRIITADIAKRMKEYSIILELTEGQFGLGVESLLARRKITVIPFALATLGEQALLEIQRRQKARHRHWSPGKVREEVRRLVLASYSAADHHARAKEMTLRQAVNHRIQKGRAEFSQNISAGAALIACGDGGDAEVEELNADARKRRPKSSRGGSPLAHYARFAPAVRITPDHTLRSALMRRG